MSVPWLCAKMQTEVKKVKEQLKKAETDLESLRKNAERQRKFQRKRKMEFQELLANEPERNTKLRGKVGRPSLECDQTELLRTIADIAIFGGAAETMRSCKTLDDIHNELLQRGFVLSRSATYLRLLPKNALSIHGRRHVTTVPVKLRKCDHDLHKSHPDTQFARTTINYLECMASFLGPSQAIFLSQDDKARVPIGVVAANKQSPVLMHLDYRIRLPDHDFVVAEGHKLIPSVYAACVIKPNCMGIPDGVTYSGPTYIVIRSGKHDSSTALTHAYDLDKMFCLKEFQDIVKIPTGSIKPVLIISVDGGPDENPRYPKVINAAIRHFKEYNFDVVFVATQAPGRSAFNRVERRMAPLSHDLSGLIIPHDHFGSHLSSNRKTVDVELEKANFTHAGKILSEVWSATVIDGFQTIATYANPGSELSITELTDYIWYSNHVRESQYLLQIVKCDDRNCCKRLRSDIRAILQNRFLPPPLPLL